MPGYCFYRCHLPCDLGQVCSLTWTIAGPSPVCSTKAGPTVLGAGDTVNSQLLVWWTVPSPARPTATIHSFKLSALGQLSVEPL